MYPRMKCIVPFIVACNTNWTCLPCMANRVVNMRLAMGAEKHDPLIIHDGEHMTYKFMQDAIKKIRLVCKPN